MVSWWCHCGTAQRGSRAPAAPAPGLRRQAFAAHCTKNALKHVVSCYLSLITPACLSLPSPLKLSTCTGIVDFSKKGVRRGVLVGQNDLYTKKITARFARGVYDVILFGLWAGRVYEKRGIFISGP